MKTRHFFAGVNSPSGFYSHFDMIAPDKDCKRKIYIKGGPGTGKSSLMKKIAAYAAEEGYDTDVFHCSSDAASLDGVYIPKLKTAVVDATAPHGDDPDFPGLNGGIFNAAAYLRRESLKEHYGDIIHFANYKKTAFSRAYAYLSAAAPLLQSIEKSYREKMYMHGVEIEAQRTISKYLPDIIMPKTGKLRKLFLSAVCPEGYVNYLDSAFSPRNTVTVKGAGSRDFCGRVLNAALSRGFSAEAFYCPMAPGAAPEHIIIPELKIAFTTYNHFHHFQGADTIDLNEYTGGVPETADADWREAENLLLAAQTALSDARAAHKCLEDFYVPAMDFESLSKDAEKIIDSIFE
ncbi:MAG: hypothetical protein J5590_07530 [Clostridia bacterium]|nr:hypothetical protein [Clostridia bacterium]